MRKLSRFVLALMLALATLTALPATATVLAAEADRWQELGGPPGVRLAARHRVRTNRVYAATPSAAQYGYRDAGGSVYRSDDGGGVWSEAAGPWISQALTPTQITTDWLVAGRVYVVGSTPTGYGLVRSDDGGATWGSVVPVPALAAGEYPALSAGPQLVPSPTAAETAFLSVGRHVYRTSDAAASFAEVGAGLPLTMSQYLVAPSRTQAGIVYAAGITTTGSTGCSWGVTVQGNPPCVISLLQAQFFRSEDNGTNFAPYGAPSPTLTSGVADVGGFINRLSLTGDADGAETLYLAWPGYHPRNNTRGLYRIAQAGTAWTKVAELAAKSDRPGEVFRASSQGTAALETIDRSGDGGATWSPYLTATQLDRLDLRWGRLVDVLPDLDSPGRALVVASIGILRTEDGGATWTATVSGLPGQQSFRIVAEPAAPYRILTGFYEAPSYAGTDRGQTWMPTSIVDAVFSPAYAADRTAVGEISDSLGYYNRTPAYALTTDSFVTWTVIPDLVALPEFSSGFAADRTIYGQGATGSGPSLRSTILRSTDGGRTWEQRSTTGIGGPNGEFPGEVFWVVRLQSDPWDPQRLYALLGGGADHASRLFVSEDGAATWQPLPLPPPAPGRGWTSLLFDLTRPGMIIVTGGSPGFGWRTFVRSQDDGQTWETVDPAFTVCSIPGTASPGCDGTEFIAPLRLDPNTGYLYAFVGPGPRYHVYRSRDAGSTWAPLPAGWEGVGEPFINRPALGLRQSQPAILYAGTNAGVWRYLDLDGYVPASADPLAIVRPGETAIVTYPVRPPAPGSAYTATLATTDWASLPPGAALYTNTIPLALDARALATGAYTTTLSLALDAPDIGVVTQTMPVSILVAERHTSAAAVVLVGSMAGW